VIHAVEMDRLGCEGHGGLCGEAGMPVFFSGVVKVGSLAMRMKLSTPSCIVGDLGITATKIRASRVGVTLRPPR